MKKNILLSIFVLLLFVFVWVSAKVVEYKYTGISNDQKRIQLVWTLVPDKDIKMTEYNHEISFLVNKSNEHSEYEIPKYTPLEQKLIDSLGYEKLNKLIWNIIDIEWYKYRFRKFHDVPWGGENKEMKLENKDILYANMNHDRSIVIESDKSQKIIFKLYPIPSEYHAVEYARDSLSNQGYKYGLPDKNTLITLYDTTSEYHNVNWSIINNPLTLSETYEKVENNEIQFSNLSPEKLKIEKKYEVFTFKREFPIWINWESKVVLPYYEFKVNVLKWRNVLNINYSTYQFEWERIQIR